MRPASPLIVLLVVFSWALPEHAGAQTPISGVDRVAARPRRPRPIPWTISAARSKPSWTALPTSRRRPSLSPPTCP
jgi:hypothetical protein